MCVKHGMRLFRVLPVLSLLLGALASSLDSREPALYCLDVRATPVDTELMSECPCVPERLTNAYLGLSTLLFIETDVVAHPWLSQLPGAGVTTEALVNLVCGSMVQIMQGFSLTVSLRLMVLQAYQTAPTLRPVSMETHADSCAQTDSRLSRLATRLRAHATRLWSPLAGSA